MQLSLNGQAVQHFRFPGGEWQIQVTQIIGEQTEIIAPLYNADAVMCLLLLVDAVRRQNSDTRIKLVLPYLPYARQDRVCNVGEALSIRVMCDLINNLQCQQVVIFDPHSDVSSALLNRVTVVTQAELVTNSSLATLISTQQLALVAPDAGAEKKTNQLAKKLASEGINSEVFYASKKRNLATGEISGSSISGDVTGRNLLLIDDICDGGRTFTGLAEVLKQQGAGDIYLYVTHGIFSQGLDVLRPYFKQVFCHHTFLAPEALAPEFLTVLTK